MKKEKGEIELVGVKEIARRANVSTATVDRVLHNRIGVSSATREKINIIIKELDYKPNILASRLASPGKYNFAVLLPDISSETDFWQAPLNGIQRAAHSISEYGIMIRMYFFDLNKRKSFKKQSRLMLDSNPDAVLFAPYFHEEAIQLGNICTEQHIPYVLIDSNIPSLDPLCYIGPHQLRSGYLSAQLMNYRFSSPSKILIVNIAKEVDDLNNLLKIEEGFRSYFTKHKSQHKIIKIDIKSTNYLSVQAEFLEVFDLHLPQAIFVTNSRVSAIADCLEKHGKRKIFMIGYDFLTKNIEFLKKDLIDILICHRPEKQGYAGIMKLYEHFVLRSTVPKLSFMPIDIITKENFEFYDN
jgi:LacI family transcriptional regulator